MTYSRFWKKYMFTANTRVKGRSKGKGHPRTSHEGPEWKKRYSSTLSLTSALDVVGGQRHAPAALSREISRTLCVGD